jgi:hypothetical protein
VTSFDRQACDSGQRAEQRERANPAETRVGADRVSRTLALDFNSRAAEDHDSETGETTGSRSRRQHTGSMPHAGGADIASAVTALSERDVRRSPVRLVPSGSSHTSPIPACGSA